MIDSIPDKSELLHIRKILSILDKDYKQAMLATELNKLDILKESIKIQEEKIKLIKENLEGLNE